MSETKKPRQFYGRLFLFWFGALLLLELTLHLTVYHGMTLRILTSLLFDMSFAAALTLITSFFRKERISYVLRYVLAALLFVLYSVQLIYYRVFDTLLSLSYMGMGGDALDNFMPTILRAMGASWLQLLLFVLPLPILFLLHRREVLPNERMSGRGMLMAVGTVLVLHILGMLPIWIAGKTSTIYRTYKDPYGDVTLQCEYFGLPTAERLELGRLMKGTAGINDEAMDLGETKEDVPEDVLELPDRNIMPELDLTGLDLLTEDKNIIQLNGYFDKLSGTLRNEYTGKFAGYNLIQICAESFSPYMVDPEITPTLYRLTHEGFLFENFYCSFPSMTTNGEYSLCMGLMPDMSRVSFATSMYNYVPFTLGNRFSELGLKPKAYHNNIATFYNRINTHPNMGYTFKAVDFGLDMEKGSPASDLEMMRKTVDDYIDEEQFIVHYMTYSGHCDYNFVDNDMCIKNEKRVEGLDLPEDLKAYYACQLELEDAMTYLLGRLEEAGVADRTVIVLTGDHYPYGLSNESYELLAGDAAKDDPFWRYRNSFALWNGGMEEPVSVQEYCCTQDILPTVLNLFGMPYESRFLTGMDVLSEGIHVAILQDGSFLTDALTYDAHDGKVEWKKPKEDYPDGYDQEMIRTVKNQFSVSASILRSDYYRFVFTSLGLADPEQEQERYYSYADTVGTWYAEDVEILTGCGVLTGNHGSFNGEDPCTRANFVVMLARALELDVGGASAPPYTDIQETAWYYDSLVAAWRAGILEESGTFRANAPITMEEAERMMTAAAKYTYVNGGADWVESVIEDAKSRAGAEEIDENSLSRGFTAALISPMTITVDEE